MKKILIALSICLTSFYSIAKVDDQVMVRKALEKWGVNIISIQPSAISNLLTVIATDGVLYVSDDGRYVLQAPLYDVSAKEPVNLTHQLLIKNLDALTDEMIVYKAAKEKHIVTIFTDITCGYCVKLHKEMDSYHQRGITIRYLAFPRQGMDSEDAKKMASIWCSADPKQAFNDAINGKESAKVSCKTDISRHYQLGVQLGVRGTPSMMANGVQFPGYQDAENLEKALIATQASK